MILNKSKSFLLLNNSGSLAFFEFRRGLLLFLVLCQIKSLFNFLIFCGFPNLAKQYQSVLKSSAHYGRSILSTVASEVFNKRVEAVIYLSRRLVLVAFDFIQLFVALDLCDGFRLTGRPGFEIRLFKLIDGFYYFEFRVLKQRFVAYILLLAGMQSLLLKMGMMQNDE